MRARAGITAIQRGLPARVLRKLYALDNTGERTLEMAMRRMSLSAHDRILQVLRAVADLDRPEPVASKLRY